ncbi:MAG: hypothetical protein IJI54_03540 [Kiritimatiellae bacterium]|nr:hypothetical protein [Kiritimatiellia bacterium]
MSFTSFTYALVSLNSPVSRTSAGSSLSACTTRLRKELTSTVCCCWSLTAFRPLQRQPRVASSSERSRIVRRLIASVTPYLTPSLPLAPWAPIEAMFALSRLWACLALMFAVAWPFCQSS